MTLNTANKFKLVEEVQDNIFNKNLTHVTRHKSYLNNFLGYNAQPGKY